MNGINVYIFFITYLLDFSIANEVVGCGGFLKSHVPIDFSKVEVKLVTKQGIIKDRTTAAPNNGYYFVPLYDKGEMLLELAPPPGWSFEPEQVEINIDGINDVCSQGKDINFVFQGFGITGKVESLGSSNNGPKGVTVHLQSKEENRTTVTVEGGNFFFTPVYPGVYKVSISHPRWKIFRKSIDVQVAESNAELQKNSLIVQGYEVMGKVASDGEPVKGVMILLFSQEENKPSLVDGCIKRPVEVTQDNKTLCHAITDDNGVYRFGVIPNGRYYLKAYFQKQNIHYRPTKIEFEINNGDSILDQQIEIIGFSIPGKVLKSKAKPVPNAKIYVNGQEVTTTDNEGAYRLEKMKTGTYKIKVDAEDLTFDEKIVRLNPSHQELPDILPSAFKVCGMVTSGQSQTVTFTQPGTSKTTVQQAQSSTQDGGFCHFLAPGQYEVQVAVGQDESQKGLQFFPLKHTIEVTSEEIMDLIFSQLKATVFGKVKCLEQKNCEELSAVMKSDNTEDLIVKIQGGSFKLEDIFPGTYKISLSPNRFCWESSEHILNINTATVDVTFIQKGYTVNLIFSHDAKVHYQLKTETKSSTIEEANKGRSTVCLPKPGEYKFTIESCHSYNMNSFSYNTDEELNEIALNAEKHIQALCIKAEDNFGDIRVIVNIAAAADAAAADAAAQTVTTLKYKDGCYRLELMLEPDESAIVQPESDTLFFTPTTLSVQGKDDCSDLGVKFVAVKGKVFQGKVSPPLEGVVLTVESSDSDPLVVETDAEGFYKFQPLDGNKEYKIQATKESYVLIGPDENGNFLARKLAEVNVEVVDSADNSSLAGVLLSLSGGDGYRKNLQSEEDGKITFNSLSPSEYFLRPMMKEYVFEPSSKIIPVNEGQTVHVRLVGKRVAYSAYGKVVSLNGEPEDNMIIAAKGIGNCSMYSEETSTDNGQFRIRGLQPYCSYVVEVKNNENAAAGGDAAVERSVPEHIPINNIKEDVRDLKLAVFRGTAQMDILVKVYSANVDHYKSLKVKLFRESGSSAMTTKIDTSSIKLTKSSNPGLMIYMPSVPLDNTSYSLHLESSLVQNKKWHFHDFVANSSFKYFELDFSPKNNIIDQPIRQTSIWTLLLIFVILVVVYNIQAVASFLKQRFDFNLSNLTNFIPLPSSNQRNTGDYFDDADIDQIVQSINNTKKKPKTKLLKK